MTSMSLALLPRTARRSLVAAFESVGVTVEQQRLGKPPTATHTPGMATFTVLRHPVDRLRSLFNLRVRAGRPHHRAGWSMIEAALFAIVHDFNSLCESLASEDEWRRSVAERMLAELNREGGTLPQFLSRPLLADITVAGTFADLPGAVSLIAERVGCTVPELSSDPAIVDPTPPSLRGELSTMGFAAIHDALDGEIAYFNALSGRVGV